MDDLEGVSSKTSLVEQLRSRFHFTRDVDGAVRFLSLLSFAILVFSLFYLGTKPIAVGLFPNPFDKVAHFATFSLMTALLWLSFFRGHPVMLAAIVSVIGLADEVHQIFLPGRTAGVDDFATDVLAAVLTSLLLVWAGGRYQSSSRG